MPGIPPREQKIHPKDPDLSGPRGRSTRSWEVMHRSLCHMIHLILSPYHTSQNLRLKESIQRGTLFYIPLMKKK